MRRLQGLLPGLVVFFSLLPSLTPAPLAAMPAKLEPRLWRDSENGQRVSAIIFLDDQADLQKARGLRDSSARGWFVYRTLVDHADRTQGPIVALLRQRGAPFSRLWAVNAIVADCDRALLTELSARPDVRTLEANVEQRGIEPEAIADVSPTPTLLPVTAIEWGVQSVNAPAVWALGHYGEGIVIADADTGIQWDHPALKSRYRGFSGGPVSHDYNWFDAIHGVSGNPCGSDTAAPCDDHGHGTHTTGTVVGDDGLGNQIGVAPGSRFIGCRNMDRGKGTPARYAECFQFFIAPTDVSGNRPDPDRRPHVINNSWGCTGGEGCGPTTLQTIVENTQAAGIFVEVSAGNSGPRCGTVDSPPAVFAAAFSTGAYDGSGRLAGFSSRGPVVVDGSLRQKPEIVAPGSRVRSSVPGNKYANFSGTSMAGPHVVGVVALLWSARPELARQIEETKALLRASAIPAPGLTSSTELCGGVSSDFVPNNSFGAGKIDALGAVTF
jgi:serine protease AprX